MKLSSIFINENQTLKSAMKIIDNGALGIAFIIDTQERLTGVVTDGDIRHAIIKGTSLNEKIKKIMNSSPVIVHEGWTENQIKNLLKKEDVKRCMPQHGAIRIPVLDTENKIIDLIFATEDECESFNYPKNVIHVTKPIVKPVNRVLVIGGAGYLGSILCRKLLKRGYFVNVLDNLTYGDHGIKELYNHKKFNFIKGDIRNLQTVVEATKNVDAVIHLAAIVGDPASALDPTETIEINYLATKLLAEVCRYSQINRFIFASTCSVYGASKTPDVQIKEDSQLNPVSLYAEMKLKSEQGIMELADDNFSPTILRMSTLYGISPRMRFDLVVNTLTIKALMEKKFNIFGGQQWRPNLHVSDAADAYIKCLESPIEKIRSEIFNVGSNEENYRIIDIGKTIKDRIQETTMTVDSTIVDERNYNVNFDKIEKNLNYLAKYDIVMGVDEIKNAVEQGIFTDYTNHIYNNFNFLKNNTSITDIE